MKFTGRASAYIEYSAFLDCDITHDVIKNQYFDHNDVMRDITPDIILDGGEQ